MFMAQPIRERRRPQPPICAAGVDFEMATSSGVMSAGISANSGVDR